MEKLRVELGDSLNKQANLDKGPTQELKTNLEKLAGLLAEKLITGEDVEVKKKQLLDKFSRRFAPKSIVEAVEEFQSIAELMDENWISAQVKEKTARKMSGKLDLAELISADDPPQEVLRQLSGLLQTEVISTEMYEQFKADIMKRV